MRIVELASTPALVTYADEPLAAAARKMRTHGVGALVVVERGAAKQLPLGILTDRDIVCGQLRRSADLYCLTVRDVMTPNPLVVSGGAELSDAIEMMSVRAVRRAPVVDDTGALIGMITLDDVLPLVAQVFGELAGIPKFQASRNTPPTASDSPSDHTQE